MDMQKFASNSKYLSAEDLRGQAVGVVIERVTEETLGGDRGDEQKGVVWFQGKLKGWALNVTNNRVLTDTFGFNSDMWLGRRIELYPTTTDYAGKIVDCIRVRIPAPETAAPLPAAQPQVPPPNAFSNSAPPAQAAPLTGAAPAQQPAVPPSGAFTGAAPATAPAAQQPPPKDEIPFALLISAALSFVGTLVA